MKKKNAIVVGVVLIVLLIGIIISNNSHNSNTIKIGAILPLTGNAAQYGQNDKKGIDLAVDLINKSGGINGKKLEIVYEDSAGEAKNAVSALHKLAKSNIIAVIDDAMSSITLAMLPIATNSKIVLLSTGASSPALSGASPYFFRIWNSDSLEAKVTANFVSKHLNYRKAIVLYVNNDYGRGLLDEFTNSFKQNGGSIILAEEFSSKSGNFRNITAKVVTQKADIIYVIGYAFDTGVLVRQLAEAGNKLPIIGTVAMEDKAFIKLAGASSNGIMYPYPASPEGRAVEYFNEQYMNKYKESPQILCDCGYDAVNILATALQNGVNKKMLLAGLKNTKYNGASGYIEFDSNGNVCKKIEFKIIDNGKFVKFK